MYKMINSKTKCKLRVRVISIDVLHTLLYRRSCICRPKLYRDFGSTGVLQSVFTFNYNSVNRLDSIGIEQHTSMYACHGSVRDLITAVRGEEMCVIKTHHMIMLDIGRQIYIRFIVRHKFRLANIRYSNLSTRKNRNPYTTHYHGLILL